MADQNKISDSLTQAQVDAEAIYAKAASIDPYKAALIKKNAQGNIMSAGVIDALSSLGVDAKSGVASSIANIDAATREQRLADQKKIAQDRQKQEFDQTKRGTFWRGAKTLVKATTGLFGTTWQWMSGEARQGIEGIAQATRSFGISSAAGPAAPVAPGKSEKYIPGANEQTYLGQALIKAKDNINKGKPFYTGIDTGNGFFISEETGIGHAARQASLDAAKIDIKNSNGKVIGSRPVSLLGDAYASVFTVGHPESQAGNVVSLLADIAGSFAYDPGLGRMQEVKALRKLASQQRAEKAFVDAAKTEERIATLEKAQDEALAEAKNIRTQAANLKTTEAEAAKAELGIGKTRAERLAANEAATNAGQGVRRAQARLDEFKSIEEKTANDLASAREARLAAEQAYKAPKNVAQAEKLLEKQRKQLEEMVSERQSALDAGQQPFRDQESIDALAEAIKNTEQKLADAKNLVGESPVTADAVLAAKELEKKTARVLRDVKEQRVYMENVVKERAHTESLMVKARKAAAAEDLKAVKNNATLSDKLNDVTLSAKDARTSWELAVKRISNIEQNYKRPEFAYQNFAEFLTSGHGSRALDKLVEMTDWKTIWRKAGGKLTAEQAQKIAAATTKDELVDILAPYLKRGELQAGALKPGMIDRATGRMAGRLNEIGQAVDARTNYIMPEVRYLVGVGAKTAQRIAHHEKVAKLFAGVERAYTTKIKSGALINIHDREALLRAAEDFGKAAKLPKETLNRLIDEIASAESNSKAGYTASVKLLDEVFNAAEGKVAPHLKESFKAYTTEFKESAEKMSSYWATRHANGAELKYMTLGGESIVLPGPHLDSEMLNSTIYLPPVSEFLKLTSRLSKYKTLSGARDISDALIGNYWKKLVLVRPAYIIRNIAEEQIRVAAVGHASFFTRPGMALAMWLGKKDGPWTRRVLHQFDTYRNTVFDKEFSTGDEALDILDETLGHGMKNSYVDMMNSNMTGYDSGDFRVLTLKSVGKVGSGHTRFFDGVTNQLRMLNSSEFARVVAGYDNKFIKAALDKGQFRQDAVIDYFLTGPGRRFLESYVDGTPDNFKAFMRTPEGLKTFLYTGKNEKGVDISMLARINEMTGGNKTLQKLVAYGKANAGGKDLRIPRASDSALNSIQNSKALREGKKALLEEQDLLSKDIEKMFKDLGNWDGVEVNVPSKNLVHMESKESKLDFVNKFFDKATEFEKNTTFGPEFRQAYWDAINDIARALDGDAKARLMKAAQDSLTPLQKAGRAPLSTGRKITSESDVIALLNSQRAKGFTIDNFKEFEESLINYMNGSGDYSLVNTILRGDYTASAKRTEYANKIISDLDSLIAKAPKLEESITTFRGISDKNVAEKLLSLKPGDSFVDKAFTSTSLKESTAEHFARGNGVIVEIVNPAGTKGIFPLGLRTQVDANMAMRASAEQEFLLPRGTKFYVSEVKGNRIKVTLESNADFNVGSKHPVWNAFKNAGNGPMTLEDAHAYADTYARNQVKELFYNAHEKRLIFHQLRLIAPFAAAWEDTVKRWSELSLENPMAVYKAVKGMEWMTKPESSAIYQMTDARDYYDPNQGFFFTEPNSGQRQFFVPFAGSVMAAVAKKATGVNYQGAPMAFSANPMSFNFAFGAGSILPGVGPGVTIPLSALGTFQGNFIDALPLGIQKWLFPFGRADFSSGLQSAILPGNWNKILGGLTGLENSYASNYKPIMNYLAGGANYNLDNPDDQAQLLKDTDTFARWESVMRGVVGLVSPMGLIQQGLAKDENGDVTLQTVLYNDFQTILQKNDGDYNKAWYDYLNLYGAPQAFALISSSAGNGPSNWDSYAFVADNPDVATKYSEVWGYVMPGGGLSTEMYQWNVAHDTKKRLTPKEILQKVNNQRFYAAKDALLTRVDAGQLSKSQFSDALQNLKTIMGGGPVYEFDPSKRDRVIRQLNELITEKRFADIPSVAGLRDYMYIRQDILSKIGKTKFTGAQNEQGARDYLAAQAEWIIKDNPDFQKMFYAFFSNELEGK